MSIDLQENGRLARRSKLNELIKWVNVLIGLRGESGIQVDITEANGIISFDKGELDEESGGGSETEELEMWVCQIIGGVPTPVQRTFIVKPEEVVD